MRGFSAVVLAAVLAAGCATAPAPLANGNGAKVRWLRTFASPNDDWINDIHRLRDGRFLAPGFLNRKGLETDWRALAVVIDADGNVERQSEYGVGAGVDSFWAVGEREDGELLHVGFTDRNSAGGLDAFVLRTGADGRQRFETAIGEAAYDRVTDIARAPGGWLMVGHSVKPGTEHRRFWLVKADDDGRPVARRLYLEGEASGGLYIEPTPDGAFVLTGGTSAGSGDLLVIKVDADGKETWRRTFGEAATPDTNHGVVVRPDGDIVVVGYTGSWGAQGNDFFAVTLAPDGAVRRHSVLGGGGADHVIGARLAPDGRIWVVGYTKSVTPENWDVMLARLDARGCFEPGAAVFAGAADDNGTAVQVLPGGDLLVAGYSKSLADGQAEDAFLMRITEPRLDDARFVTRVAC